MTLTNDEVVQRFVRGGTEGKSNRMAIEAREGWTFLWGYGHALYAARCQDSGALFVYWGWHGYSQTTSTHMNALKSEAKGAYGDLTPAGEGLAVHVDGEGAEVTGHDAADRYAAFEVSADPGTSYGKLKTHERPELADFDGRHLSAPSGYGG